MLNSNSPAIERFMNRVYLGDDRFTLTLKRAPVSQCLIWKGTKTDKMGYGEIIIDGKKTRAHRFSYEHVHGPIPEGMVVCHRCDTPACVNPNHLFLGSVAVNNADMRSKGRHAHGEIVPQAQLTGLQVRDIIRRLGAGEPAKPIAREYGVHFVTISDIKLGRTWSHLPGTEGLPTLEQMQTAKPLSKHVAVLDAEKVGRIKALMAQGVARKQIAIDFGVSKAAIDHIGSGRTWGEVKPPALPPS